MLSNLVRRIPLSAISFVRDERQRREIDISDIEESIRRRGVLTPICVTKSGRLIFGERRLTAAIACGHTEILARIAPDDLTEHDLQLLELEENIMRQDLPWQDKALAFAKLRALNPAPTIEAFADSLGYKPAWVHRMLAAAEEIHLGNERVISSPALNKAINVISRQKERDENNALADIIDTIANGDSPPVQSDIPRDDILLQSFHDWAATYAGPRFNLIHCDFPYGVGLDESDQLQVGGSAHSVYEDSPSTFWSLVDTLILHRERFISHSAHMIFWYSMKYHEELLERFRSGLPEWTFDDYPLVWFKSDNRGIAPDVERRPRRVYETALFGWCGDRKLVRLASNCYPAPKEASAHPSTKPEPMLRHFFQMVIDPNTRLLDPTCGSGTALRAAETLSAGSILGLEIDPTFRDQAIAKIRTMRSTARLAEMVT